MFLKWLHVFKLFNGAILFMLPHVRSIMLLRPCVAMGVQYASLGITHRCRCSEGTIVYKRCIRRLMFARAHTCIERYTYLQSGWERRSNFSADVRFDAMTQVGSLYRGARYRYLVFISLSKISVDDIFSIVKSVNDKEWFGF